MTKNIDILIAHLNSRHREDKRNSAIIAVRNTFTTAKLILSRSDNTAEFEVGGIPEKEKEHWLDKLNAAESLHGVHGIKFEWEKD